MLLVLLLPDCCSFVIVVGVIVFGGVVSLVCGVAVIGVSLPRGASMLIAPLIPIPIPMHPILQMLPCP